jgi:hypothetical protein
MTAAELAPILYARYTANSGGLNYRGHWRAVAQEAIDRMRPDLLAEDDG